MLTLLIFLEFSDKLFSGLLLKSWQMLHGSRYKVCTPSPNKGGVTGFSDVWQGGDLEDLVMGLTKKGEILKGGGFTFFSSFFI